MRCILTKGRYGHKLVDADTGRLYGYIRDGGTKANTAEKQIQAIKAEIEKYGYYDTEQTR